MGKDLDYIYSTDWSDANKLSVNNDITHINANKTSRTYILHALKLNDINIDTLVKVTSFILLSRTNDDFLWSIVLNPTISGGGTLTFNDVSNSNLKHALGTDNYINNDGLVLYSGYIEGNRGDNIMIDNKISFGTNDVLMFCARPISNGLDVLGAINWRELS